MKQTTDSPVSPTTLFMPVKQKLFFFLFSFFLASFFLEQKKRKLKKKLSPSFIPTPSPHPPTPTPFSLSPPVSHPLSLSPPPFRRERDEEEEKLDQDDDEILKRREKSPPLSFLFPFFPRGRKTRESSFFSDVSEFRRRRFRGGKK